VASRARDASSRRLALKLTTVGVGAVFAAPIAYLLVSTVSLGGDFLGLVSSPRTLGPLSRTLSLAAASALACALIGTTIAWVTTKTDLRGARVWLILASLPLVIPSFVGAAALRQAFGQGGLVESIMGWPIPRPYGFWGAFTAITILSYPYVVIPVAARFRALPRSLEEGARMLGSGPWAVFWRVVLPQSWNVILGGSLLVALYAVSDFGAVSLMRFDTLTRAIYSARLFDRPTSVTLSLILGLLALAAAGSQQIGTRSTNPGSLATGSQPVIRPLGAWRPVVTLSLVGTVGLGLFAPIAVFAFWWLRGSAAIGAGFEGFGDSLAILASPALNTAVASILAAVVAVGCALPVAYMTARHRNRAGNLAATFMLGGFALPGLVIALAVVYWSLSSPVFVSFYQTLPLLILAYVIHFGAQALSATQDSVRALGSRVGEAARTLGAGTFRRLITVELPIMIPGLGAGAGLVLLSTMKELPATLLLAPIGFRTLATQIWNAAEDGFLAEVGVTSLALILISGVLTWFLVLRRVIR